MLENTADADKTTDAPPASHTLARLIIAFERVDWREIPEFSTEEAATIQARLQDTREQLTETMPDSYLANLRVTHSTLDKFDTPHADAAMADVHQEIEQLEAEQEAEA